MAFWKTSKTYFIFCDAHYCLMFFYTQLYQFHVTSQSVEQKERWVISSCCFHSLILRGYSRRNCKSRTLMIFKLILNSTGCWQFLAGATANDLNVPLLLINTHDYFLEVKKKYQFTFIE